MTEETKAAKFVAEKAEAIEAMLADLPARRKEAAGVGREAAGIRKRRKQMRFKDGSYLTEGQVEDETFQTKLGIA